jgi:serine/threonine protein kinase
MSSKPTQDNLVDDILINCGQEILDDELSSPVFCNLVEIDAQLPAFSRRGMRIQLWENAILFMESQFTFLFIIEVHFGPVLGLGAFGVVREVKNIDLLDASHFSLSTLKTDITTNSNESELDDSQTESEDDNESETGMENVSDCYYSSRNGLAALCKRNGESRYAVKTFFVEDACVEQQARARIDLAIEVSYLKVLSHPHIVKIRGTMNTANRFDPKFFFLMDRLYGTLHDKIEEWDQSIGRKKIGLMDFVLKPFRSSTNHSWNREFMKERLFVAHDIASAFKYMHQQKVIHR